MFNKFNDEISDATKLSKFARSFPSKVNIIEYNPIEQAKFMNASKSKLDAFVSYLESKKVTVTHMDDCHFLLL